MAIKQGKPIYGVFVDDGTNERACLMQYSASLEEAIEFSEGLAVRDGRAYFVYDLLNWQLLFVLAPYALVCAEGRQGKRDA